MSDNKLEQAVFKVFRMTHEGALTWVHKPVPRLWQEGSNEIYPIYFETTYQNRKLALFERRSRVSGLGKQWATITGRAVDDWAQSAHLALLGGNHEILFEFPASRQIEDLLETVRYKEANVDEFVDALLTSEATNEKK